MHPYSVWSHPLLPPSADTVLIPPPEEDDAGRAALAVLRRFDFDNEIRMMSTLVLELPPGTLGGDHRSAALLAKGAPERYGAELSATWLFRQRSSPRLLTQFRHLWCQR